LENVASLSLKRQADLCLSVRNPVDHTQVRERIVIDTSDYEPPVTTHSAIHHHHHGSKKHSYPDHEEGACHFALKWHHDEPARSTIRVIFPPPSSSSSLSSSSSDEDEEEQAASKSKSKSKKSSKSKKKAPPALTAAAAAIASLKRAVTSADSDTYVPILALDCQGEIEPFEFHPLGQEFVVVNTHGHETVVDLSNAGGCWNHVDLATGSTAVLNFQSKFE
jgi:hypothetical protein